MRITIKPFELRGFNLSPISQVALRVYALNYFVRQSDGVIVQPGGPAESPFYEEWPCTRHNGSLLLPEIALESTIDALAPAHPESLRYYAGFFDPGGNMLCAFWPRPIFALDTNPNPTTWAHVIAYNSPGVEFDWTTTYAEHYSKEEFNAMLQNPPVSGITVLPPLQFDGTTLWIPRASSTQDGYLAAEDFVAFSGGTMAGVLSFNTREGAVVLLNTDIAAALGFTPVPAVTQVNAGTGLEVAEGGTTITTVGTLRIASQPGVIGGMYFNPTITVNAQGQITHIVSGTGGDTTPPVISNVRVTALGTNSATISWDTDDASDSKIFYGTTTAYTDAGSPAYNASPQTAHAIPLSGLIPNTTYHFHVVSVASSGTADSLTSGDLVFTTHAALDTTPPTFSNVAISGLTDTTVTITWDTNELADTQVAYGLSSGSYGTAFPGSPVDTGGAMKTTGHTVTLTSLLPSHTYHYQLKSRDAAGNLGLSSATLGDLTFVTTAAATDPTIGLISYWKLDETSGARADSVGPSPLTWYAAIDNYGSGIAGNAAKFTGPDFLIASGDDPSSHPSGSFTVAGWIYFEGTLLQVGAVLARWGNPGQRQFGLLAYYDSPGNTYAQFAATRDGTAATDVAVLIPGIALNAWHFIVGWFNVADSSLHIQADGGTPVQATIPGSGPLFTGVGGLVSGIWSDGTSPGTYLLTGRTDEIGIWNRVLTSAEVTLIYTKGLAGISYPWP